MDTRKTCVERRLNLSAQIFITILDAIVNRNGGGDLYNPLITHRIFSLTMNRLFIQALKIKRKAAVRMI